LYLNILPKNKAQHDEYILCFRRFTLQPVLAEYYILVFTDLSNRALHLAYFVSF